MPSNKIHHKLQPQKLPQVSGFTMATLIHHSSRTGVQSCTEVSIFLVTVLTNHGLKKNIDSELVLLSCNLLNVHR